MPARLVLPLAALAAAAVAAVALTGGSTAAVGNCTPQTSWGTLDRSYAQQVLTLVNQHRASRGVVALTASPSLTAAAEWKSLHMAGYGYFSHSDPAPPVARSVGERLVACGYPVNAGWGENIAAGYTTPAAVMQAWLNSPGHRANIERSSFRSLGVGVARSSSGRLYWTQDFGTSTAGTSPAPPPPPPAPSPPPPSPAPGGDTTAPTMPGPLTVTATTSTSMSVRWGASSDNVGVTGYRLYRSGVYVGATTGLSHTFTGLRCGGWQYLAVRAQDAAGNLSPQRLLLTPLSC
jgi:uncharacterized protein YkwD